MVFGYTPPGSDGMSYCNQTPFPLRKGRVWVRDYLVPRPNSTHAILRRTGRAQGGRTSSTKFYKAREKNYIPFLGMQKVHEDLNK